MKSKEMNVWFSDLLDYDWVGGGAAPTKLHTLGKIHNFVHNRSEMKSENIQDKQIQDKQALKSPNSKLNFLPTIMPKKEFKKKTEMVLALDMNL